jgi:hypothetical protein
MKEGKSKQPSNFVAALLLTGLGNALATRTRDFCFP